MRQPQMRQHIGTLDQKHQVLVHAFAYLAWLERLVYTEQETINRCNSPSAGSKIPRLTSSSTNLVVTVVSKSSCIELSSNSPSSVIRTFILDT
jgi:hypothetical protein